MQNTSTKLLSVRQLAEELGLSERTVWTLYRREGCPHFRIGRTVRFNLDRVMDWLENREVNGSTPTH